MLAALAVGHVLGLAPSEMAPGLDDPSIQIHLRRLPGWNGSLLLDDTYNATTASVLAGLGVLESSRASRTIAVLGDMLELGSLAEEEHRAVGRRAARAVDLLVTYGALAGLIADEAATTTSNVTRFRADERMQVVEFLRGLLQPGDAVLFKGSRSLRMEEFVEALSAAATA